MYRTAVIDTGPLFSALVLNFDLRAVDFGRAPRFTHILGLPLQRSPAQRAFLELLQSIRSKLTTSHVMAEVSGLSTSRLNLDRDERRSFWRASIDLLTQWDMDETLIRLLDLAAIPEFQTCLPDIGATDTGLIQLALRHGCVLITEDERTLAPQAWGRGVDCQLVKQLLPTLG